MAAPDVISLRQFYSSPLGRRVKQRLRQLLLEHWPEHAGETILGIGYATPLLRALEHTSGATPTLVAAMPARQGAIYWPIHADNRSFLADELALPIHDNSVHRIILLHSLEHQPEPEKLIEECFRILVPGGRMFIVIPNRRGLWQALGATPYALGTPYRAASLKQLLRGGELTLRDSRTALFALPLTHPFWLKTWPLWEFIGRVMTWGLGGVLVVEAEKQIYAAIPEPVKAKASRRWVQAPAPVVQS